MKEMSNSKPAWNAAQNIKLCLECKLEQQSITQCPLRTKVLLGNYAAALKMKVYNLLLLLQNIKYKQSNSDSKILYISKAVYA